ncbi:MAG TPA: hypothetical protein VFS08_05490 [Gemmatimonadaceae bacterium]|nr:hypothetical protein [Gemmatimonadaceae bacterium]
MRARVRAAFRAAAFRPAAPFVRAALRAAALRSLALRLRAADRACFDRADFDADERPSFFSAFVAPRARLAVVRAAAPLRPAALRFRLVEDVAVLFRPVPFRAELVRAVDFLAEPFRAVAFRAELFFAVAFFAVLFFAVAFFAVLFLAALFRAALFVPPFFGTFTPASRALFNPMAMACSGERAPCFPSRTWWISSRTYSPACVLADLPSRRSCSARSVVSCSGIASSVALHTSADRGMLTAIQPVIASASLHEQGQAGSDER